MKTIIVLSIVIASALCMSAGNRTHHELHQVGDEFHHHNGTEGEWHNHNDTSVDHHHHGDGQQSDRNQHLKRGNTEGVDGHESSEEHHHHGDGQHGGRNKRPMRKHAVDAGNGNSRKQDDVSGSSEEAQRNGNDSRQPKNGGEKLDDRRLGAAGAPNQGRRRQRPQERRASASPSN